MPRSPFLFSIQCSHCSRYLTFSFGKHNSQLVDVRRTLNFSITFDKAFVGVFYWWGRYFCALFLPSTPTQCRNINQNKTLNVYCFTPEYMKWQSWMRRVLRTGKIMCGTNSTALHLRFPFRHLITTSINVIIKISFNTI